MDYYSILGIDRNATEQDIRKAYKKMSMQHHPDRGGDEETFKKVNEAYSTLKDPQKKQMYDMGGNPNQGYQRQGNGPFEFHFGSGNMDDFFAGFGFGGHRQAQNRSVNVGIDIRLEDVLYGKDIDAEVSLPGHGPKIINIKIPKGIQSGQQIRYQGLGDDTIKNIRPGDLIVNINVLPHRTFVRNGDNIICEKQVDVLKLITGTKEIVTTLDGRRITIGVPKGTQPDTLLSCKGEGLPNIQTGKRGNLLIKIKGIVPKNLSQDAYDKIEEINNGI
jgi:curved DNA-binding protein